MVKQTSKGWFVVSQSGRVVAGPYPDRMQAEYKEREFTYSSRRLQRQKRRVT